ncbi:MAG: hypothetical protein PHE84_16085, partial [bacterium]|nr:hypothetical protein [bacterium]
MQKRRTSQAGSNRNRRSPAAVLFFWTVLLTLMFISPRVFAQAPPGPADSQVPDLAPPVEKASPGSGAVTEEDKARAKSLCQEAAAAQAAGNTGLAKIKALRARGLNPELGDTCLQAGPDKSKEKPKPVRPAETQMPILIAPEQLTGTLGGLVKSEKGEALGAVIEFSGGAVPALKADPTTGIFKGEVAKGKYQVTGKRDGYLPEEKSVTVNPGQNTRVDFNLKP